MINTRRSGNMLNGIDVSQHQGIIDWGKAKAVGKLDFAIIRASCSRHVDARLALNVIGCKNNGLYYGFYHTLYADSVEGARTEAKIFLTSIKGYDPDFPVYVDTEFWTEKNGWTNTKLSKRLWTDMVLAFGEECEKAGYYFGVYASRSFIQNTLLYDELKRFDFWLAEWDVTSPTWNGNHGVWQYVVRRGNQASFGMPGTNGLDMDYATKDYPNMIRNAGLNGFKKYNTEVVKPVVPPKATPPKPIASKPVKTVHKFAVNDRVTIKDGAKTYTDGKVDDWVYAQNGRTFLVDEIKGDRAVLQKGGINTPFNVKDLNYIGRDGDITPAKPVIKSASKSVVRKYKILPGDSFCGISAKMYGTEARAIDIAKANGMNINSTIYAGKTLVIPQ